LELPTLLHGCEAWAIRKQEKSMSKEMEFTTAKYTQQDYKTIEDILPRLKINPVVKKIKNYRTKCKHVQHMARDRL